VSSIVNFATDWTYGVPSPAAVEERMAVMKRVVRDVNAKRGISFPTGIQFVNDALELNVSAGDPTRSSLDAIEYMRAFSAESGVQLPAEITKAMQGLDPSFVFDFSDAEINKWVGAAGQLMTTSLDQAGKLAGPLSAGFDFVGALSDGNITAAEGKKIASSAGAAVGGAIGSIIPGIGTAIGTIIGSTIGALVGEIVAWINPPQPDFAAALEAQREQIASYLRQASSGCDAAKKRVLTESINPEIVRLSDFWHSVELTLGFRFPLRWFQNNPGLDFEKAAYLYDARNFGLPPHLSTPLFPRQALLQATTGAKFPPPTRPEYGALVCQVERTTRRAASGASRYTGTEAEGLCNFYCPQNVLGCLYPDVRPGAFGPYRVLDALKARGFDLKDISCSFVDPTDDAHKQATEAECKRLYKTGTVEEREAKCAEYALAQAKIGPGAAQNEIKRQLEKFQVAQKYVSADLVQTSNLMHSQLQLFRDKLQLMQPTKVRSPATQAAAGALAEHKEEQEQAASSGKVLAAGGALLLLALAKKGGA
jgi:hypothetical protein